MKTNLFKNWAGGAMAAILFLAGGTGFVANAQDQPPPPADNSMPDDSSALPSNIDPSSPLAQVVKLTQSGVGEGVIMAYVTNSTSTFNLNPDKIIYLKDIGVPDELVTAMMQRDQVLAASANQPPQPVPVADTTVADATYAAPPPETVTVDYFYGTLAPYGTWVDVEGYGRCWRPTVMVANAGWQPYSDHGHWVWTDDGWFWISDYSWGWAPFHYGRWFRDARLGWCWYPDTVWGPSWVTWRYSDDYCGWAPLPPRCVYREGVGFFYNGAAVSIGFDFGLGVGAFTFVPTRNFCDPHPRRYRVESREATQIFGRTTVINNFGEDSHNRTFINHGIDPDRITRVTHTEIHPVTIRDTTSRVARGEQLGRDGRTLMVNRPHFTDNPLSNRGESPHAGPSSPVVGSPYQSPHNGDQNNNSQPPRNYQPVQPTSPGQQRNPPATTPGSPGRNQVTTPASPSPGNRYAPITPVQPQSPNYNSPDNRRYPSPRTQQTEQQNPRVNSGNTGGRVVTPVTPQAPANPPEANHYSPPQQPQHNYAAPVTPPSPPVQQPAPVQPQQRNYVSPRNQTPPSESRPNYSQPPAQGNQSHAAPSSSSSSPKSQGSSGRDRNQNGH